MFNFLHPIQPQSLSQKTRQHFIKTNCTVRHLHKNLRSSFSIYPWTFQFYAWKWQAPKQVQLRTQWRKKQNLFNGNFLSIPSLFFYCLSHFYFFKFIFALCDKVKEKRAMSITYHKVSMDGKKKINRHHQYVLKARSWNNQHRQQKTINLIQLILIR